MIFIGNSKLSLYPFSEIGQCLILIEYNFLFVSIQQYVDLEWEFFLSNCLLDSEIVFIGDEVSLPIRLMEDLVFLDGILLAELPFQGVELHGVIRYVVVRGLHYQGETVVGTESLQ